jgi:ribonucleoside-triphosphate reductase
MSTTNKSVEILSDVIVHMKYARYNDELKRRETWGEIVNRNKEMHQRKYPRIADAIENIYNNFVLTKKILPSMRSMQFAGKAIEQNHARIYNCAYLPVDDYHAFSEALFLLLGGTGVGYSVQYRHVEKLPCVQPKSKSPIMKFVIEDSIEGWADSVKALMKGYLETGYRYEFDYSKIRDKGTRLVTAGGKAPGAAPLRACIEKIEGLMEGIEIGAKMTTIQAHDVMCHLADAVLAGGIRRAALISLFSNGDESMLKSKSGAWWEDNPQRGRANNSMTLERGDVTRDEFFEIWKAVEDSRSGEPGFYWNNNMDWGTNPCCEIALRPFQFCNLVEINASNVVDQDDFNARVSAATFVGTLQAGYSDFHYLRSIWRETTEKDALIGVSLTGIASGAILDLDINEASSHISKVNSEVADLININVSARQGTVKPAGTTSLVLGTSSGIHGWHSEYYFRRVRVNKDEAIYKYLKEVMPELVEDEVFSPELTAVLSIPQKAPEGSIFRDESPIQLLERIKRVHEEWILPTHMDGYNTHNVSATVSIKDDEWEMVGNWFWNNRASYNGLSVLPFDGGTYQQAPFEEISKETFDKYVGYLADVDLTKVIEETDETNLSGEIACAGGACEI